MSRTVGGEPCTFRPFLGRGRYGPMLADLDRNVGGYRAWASRYGQVRTFLAEVAALTPASGSEGGEAG